MTIYLIALATEDDNGYQVSDIDGDFGYFTSRELVEDKVEKLNAPQVARHAKKMEAYEKARQKYHADNAKARALGFQSKMSHPWKPSSPDLYEVVEVDPAT